MGDINTTISIINLNMNYQLYQLKETCESGKLSNK